MTTLENTISMIKILPEADLVEIQDFTEKLMRRRERALDDAVGGRLRTMTEEDFLRDAEMAEQQFANGEYQEIFAGGFEK